MPASATCPTLAELPPPPPGKTGWPWTEAGPLLAAGRAAAPDWPALAVVTPSYQQAEFLEETIRSVLLQGYPNLRYAIMDGGSTDGSVELIRKYEPWLDYWFTGPDGGQAQAIDLGFDRIGGEILVWLNSDDVFEPNALRQAARQFSQHPAAILIYGNARHIARDGTPTSPADYVRQADRQYLVHVANAIAQPSAYFRRVAYEAAGKLDHDLKWSLDYDLWIRLAGHGALLYFPEMLSRMRIYPEAKTSRGLPAMFDEMRAVGQRYGGYGQLNQMAGWLLPDLLAKAMQAIRQGDLAHGLDWLTSVMVCDPAWRSEPRLAEWLAGEAWRQLSEAAGAPEPTLRWVLSVCRMLPERFVSRASVERRVLGLLYQALAFQSHQRRQNQAALRYAWQAMTTDGRRAANRGLWSIAIRSLVNA